jgi:integrase
MTGHVGSRELARKGRAKTAKKSWHFVLYSHKHPETGKWVRVVRRGFKREQDAKDALAAAILAAKERGPHDPRTFEQVFRLWIDGLKGSEDQYSPKTLERYGELGQYAVRMIGPEPMQELDALRLQQALDDLRKRGGAGRNQGKPLSAKTVREIASVMSSVFKSAVRLKVIKSNPMSDVSRPRSTKREPKHLEIHQLERIAAATHEHEWLELLIALDSATGCRRGELLALEWPDVDSVAGTVAIRKSLCQTREGLLVKSTKNRQNRTLSLPDYAIEALKRHGARQQRNRELLGAGYSTQPDLVFADYEGQYLKPDSVSSKVSLLMRELGLPAGYSLHSLRHTVATHLLAEKVPLPAVSKRLGHHNPHTTATIYAHALAEHDRDVADILGARFGGKVEPKKLIAPDSTRKNSK